jgi:D-3-phosphoglycerate dehydrogenase
VVHRVVIAEKIADVGVELLSERFDVDLAVGVPPDELAGRLADATALIVRSATQVDAGLLAAAPHLKVIGRAGIGVDNIDLDTATAAGILVVNAPAANTISAAEHTMALLLAQARSVPAADASLRAGRWERARFQGVELHGKTLGILGLGRIGTLVAQRASAFGMKIVAYDPFVSTERARRLGVEMGDLDHVLSRADFVTVHLPRTRETEGLVGEDAFAKMKPGVRIVNVARGGIVDEEALAAAVKAGRVAGAAVDVFATEPATMSPLFSLEEVVVTPHLGASTREAQDKAGIAVAEAVVAALDGELVPSAVNLDLGVAIAEAARPYLPLAEQLGAIYTTFSRGLPEVLTVVVSGKLAEFPVRPLAMGTVLGALRSVSSEPVSYVNVTRVAETHGLVVREAATAAVEDYQSVLRLVGEVHGTRRSVAGTIMARKGLVLTEVDGYDIEFPLTRYMLLVRNDDKPGAIGRVGTLLGDAGVNIADMAVGRHPDGAMMGLSLDSPLPASLVEELQALPGITAVRYIDLSRLP